MKSTPTDPKLTYAAYKEIVAILSKDESIDVVEIIETLASTMIHTLGGDTEHDREATRLFFDDVEEKVRELNAAEQEQAHNNTKA